VQVRVSLGDRVRILIDPATVDAGWADREGTCCGFTTPSVSHLNVVGIAEHDLAVNVQFGSDETASFAPNLVTFVDHAPGTIMTIGEKQMIRNKDGAWKRHDPV
jgi:hypothetical protein